MCEIYYNEGIHIGGTDLWFDAGKKVNLSFVSHANIDSLPDHDRIITTPETLKLLEPRGTKSIALSCPYNRPFSLGKARIELLPSGYSLGSSQILTEVNNRRIVYTGDLKIRSSPTTKFIEIRRCDVLIMKCRYGTPDYYFPEFEDISEKIYEFSKESLFFNYTPVIFIDIFGKAQDLALYLGNKNLNLSVHKSIYRYIELYSGFGFKFGNVEKFRARDIKRKVLILPLHKRNIKQINQLNKKRTCVVTGLAKGNEKVIRSTFKVDMAYAMSNHAGYDELLQYVEVVKPKEIFLIEGNSVDFANKLNSMGYNARPLESQIQLKLL